MTLSSLTPRDGSFVVARRIHFLILFKVLGLLHVFRGEMFGAAWDRSQTTGLLPYSWFGA
jgi:hypothetical protein